MLVCLTFLLPAFPASVPAQDDLKLFSKYADSVAGQIPVIRFASQCGRTGHQRCLEVLRRWSRTRGVHPLTAQAVDHFLAQELRVFGKRRKAVALTNKLGFLKLWTYAGIDGEELVLAADPASGWVSSRDWVELPPGEPHRFTATLESAGELSAALRLEAANLDQICVDSSCTTVERFEKPLFDQLVHQVQLKKGANNLELRFSSEITSVSFSVRITTPGGKEIPFAAEAADASIRLAPPGKRSRKKAAPVNAALSELLHGKNMTTPEFLLACYATQASGWTGAEDIQALLDIEGLDSRDDWVDAIRCLKGRTRQLEILRKARALYPDDPGVLMEAVSYRLQSGQQWNAWRLLGKLCQDGGFSCLDPGLHVQAVLLAREALHMFGLVFYHESLLREALKRVDVRVPDLVAALSDVLADQERYGEVISYLAGYVKKWPGDYRIASILMFALDRCARLEEELSLVEQLVWLFPTSSYLGETLASLYERLGRSGLAAEVYGALEAKGRHNPYLLDRAAQFHYAAGNTDKALELWKRVLRLRPDDGELSDLVERLQTGDSGAEQFEVDDAEIRELAGNLPADKEGRFLGVMDRTRVKLFENRAWATTRVLAVLAVAPTPGKPYYYDFAFDSYLEEATLIRADILRKDGTVSPATDYGDVGVSEEEYNLYYDLRQMVIRFDDVRPGDIILAVYEIETSASTLTIPFNGLLWLQEAYPKYNVSVEIVVPAGTELFHHVGAGAGKVDFVQTIDEEPGQTRHSFSFGRLAQRSDDPYPPGRFDRIAYLHYSTMEDWEEFALWYAGILEGLAQIDASMKRLVKETVALNPDKRSVTEQLCRYVADEVRYVGLEFGVHGLKPYSPVEVFRRGFGDCKDKSLLLVTLLKEAGIKANLVALMTAPLGVARLYPGSPSLFDHAIVYLAEEDLFFDPTARYVGLSRLPWQDQGSQAIVIDAENRRELLLPESASDENVASFSAFVRHGETFLVEGEIRFSGQFAWTALQALENRGSWENTVEAHVSGVLPVVDISTIEEEVLEGSVPAVAVRFTGTWLPGSGSSVKLLSGVGTSASLVGLAERNLPMQFGYPYTQSYELGFEPGVFRELAVLDESRVEEEAAYEVSARKTEAGHRVSVLFEQKEKRISTERYAAFRQLMHRYQEVLTGLEGQIDQ